MTAPILVRGGRVLPMTPGSGEIAADILIRGDRIAAIAPHINCPDAEVIDARGRIVLPGFVDAHRHVAATPETEMQMGMGFPVAFRARDAGVRSSLGIDIVSNYSGDMFSQMRLCLQASRALDNREYERRDRAPRRIRIHARDVLDLATRGGAEAAGLGDRTGTLEVGKQADLVLLRTDAIHMTPSIDAFGAAVLHANCGDVDTVFIAGQCRKKDGRLVGVDWPSLSARLHASSRRIIEGMQSVSLPMIEDLAAQMMPRLE